MNFLLDSKTAKKLDVKTQELGIPDIVLMERAALSVAEFIRDKGRRGRIIAFCGMGNNGGDGVACVRILKEWGYKVLVYMFGNPEKMSALTKKQIDIARNCSIEPLFVKSLDEVPDNTIPDFTENDTILDALFGVGLGGTVSNSATFFNEVMDLINLSPSFKIAIDIPSGVDGTTGEVTPGVAMFDATVTFGFSKVGISVYPGKKYAGEVTVTDIGFISAAISDIIFPAFTYEKSDLINLINKREQDTNKGDYGKILIVAGEMPGAAFLSALSAYRYGAGLVRIFTPESNKMVLQTLIPEAIVTSYADEGLLSDITKLQLKNLIKNWADILVVGSGLGRSEKSYAILKTVMELRNNNFLPVKTVIDADGIYLLKKYIDEFGLDLQKDLGNIENLILTPHLRELSILLNKDVNYVKNNLINIANDFFNYRFVLVMKDAATLVVGNGKIYINVTGNAAMAKAGSGDVLTGIIAGLLGQRKINTSCYSDSIFSRVTVAVYLHGMGGDMASKKLGENAILARDIVS